MRKSDEIPEDSWFMIEFPKNWRSHSSGNFSAMPPSAIWTPERIEVTSSMLLEDEKIDCCRMCSSYCALAQLIRDKKFMEAKNR